MFSNLKKDTIIITNNSYKKNILKELSKDNKLYPITFMSLKEFIDNYFYYNYELDNSPCEKESSRFEKEVHHVKECAPL